MPIQLKLDYSRRLCSLNTFLCMVLYTWVICDFLVGNASWDISCLVLMCTLSVGAAHALCTFDPAQCLCPILRSFRVHNVKRENINLTFYPFLVKRHLVMTCMSPSSHRLLHNTDIQPIFCFIFYLVTLWSHNIWVDLWVKQSQWCSSGSSSTHP